MNNLSVKIKSKDSNSILSSNILKDLLLRTILKQNKKIP
jgi:hypothetical protein